MLGCEVGTHFGSFVGDKLGKRLGCRLGSKLGPALGDLEGRPVGVANPNYMLDRRKYAVQFEDGSIKKAQKIIRDVSNQIKKVDPESFQEINPNDTVRLRRIWEVFELTGKKFSEWKLNSKKENRIIICPISIKDNSKFEFSKFILCNFKL